MSLALASFFGPGLYGNRTASGITLKPSTIGVAHRSLPFGTRVRFEYMGRTLTTEVIDRGPAEWTGKEWDLTEAAFKQLAPLSIGVIEVNATILGTAATLGGEAEYAVARSAAGGNVELGEIGEKYGTNAKAVGSMVAALGAAVIAQEA